MILQQFAVIVFLCILSLYFIRDAETAEVFESINAEPESIIQGKATVCEQQASKLNTYQQNLMRNLHNKYRKKPWATNMKKMNIGPALTTRAQALANTCKFEHGMQEFCSGKHNGKRMGQNLYVIYGGEDFPKLNFTKAVDLWFQENKNYNIRTLECSGVCGHYTQVVWAASGYVGCGYAKCPTLTISSGKTAQNGIILVCNYFTAGNYAGVAPFSRGQRCSNCPTGTVCKNNLCV